MRDPGADKNRAPSLLQTFFHDPMATYFFAKASAARQRNASTASLYGFLKLAGQLALSA